MSIAVTEMDDGFYMVIGPFETNESAWKEADRFYDEPNSPIKARYFWSQGKQFYD